jgi:hypothetical protein
VNFEHVVTFEFQSCVNLHGELLTLWFVVSATSCNFNSKELQQQTSHTVYMPNFLSYESQPNGPHF